MNGLKKLFAVSLVVIILLVVTAFIFNYEETEDTSLIQIDEDFQPDSYKKNSTLFEMIRMVNESTLEKHVQTIQDFGPHPTGSTTLDKVKEYIYHELTNSGLTVRYDQWRYKLRRGENIEAALPGIGSSDGIVIVCAHYDSVFISPGADDDGSGVAAILTIAEIMSKYEFNSTVKFVFFSGEEQGLLGSHEYAKEIYENEDHILGVVCLDGIGYAKTAKDGHTIKNYADEHSDWIYDMSKDITVMYNDYVDLDIERFPNERISDHHSFYELGFSTSYFLEYTLDPFYHTSEDTIDKMNMSYLTKVCRLALGTVAGMAEVDRVLRNDDIKISIQGSILSYPDQLTVRVENKRYYDDTANLTVHIEMKNVFTGKYVEGPYDTVSNWVFSEEVDEYWEFVLAAHRYNKFKFLRLEVTVKGFNDDIGLYKERHTFGIVGQSFILLIPKF